jgi:hypothetical protein
MFGEKKPKRKLLASYVAGIIDGEGAITLYRSPNGYFQFRVSVSNTNKELLDRIRADFGGLEVRAMGNTNPHARTSYQWSINGRDCIPILEETLPFLIVKRKHAELGLEFLKECSRGPGRSASPEQMARAAEIAQEMKKHNMKGPQADAVNNT